jgi:hypothetical protein
MPAVGEKQANKRLQATAYSLRSYLASAFGPAYGCS